MIAKLKVFKFALKISKYRKCTRLSIHSFTFKTKKRQK